ncbi:MAG: ATP synthase F0 subunit B [Peptococcaceae bacterium]|nr:ATP synthase F0 subunit B [Peptococcaceae bacterium]
MENRLLDLIEQLEEIIDHGTKVPLTGKVMVDEEVVLEILDSIRTELPEEIRQANLLLADRDRLIENARLEGQMIVERAEKQAEQLLKEDEITIQSRAYAEELVEKAQQYSREVKLGALKYSDELLNDIALKLEEVFKTIQASREELSNMARWDDNEDNNAEE